MRTNTNSHAVDNIELIGLYDHISIHVGQFTLPVDAGCLNEDRTAFKAEALSYILELSELPAVSKDLRDTLEEGFIKKFCLYRYND